MLTVISLGGSIVAPDAVDTAFLGQFRDAMRTFLAGDPARRLILIVGGGGPARHYQEAYRALAHPAAPEAQDWIGIMATRLNAELVRQVFAAECSDPVVTDPSAGIEFGGRILVAAGWKPGFSTDFDAVWLGERFGAKTIINLSNIPQVYTDDPKKNPGATPLATIDWATFRSMVGTTWTPGQNLPFDPIASQKAAELGLTVICALGRNLPNLVAILEGQPFIGTTIG